MVPYDNIVSLLNSADLRDYIRFDFFFSERIDGEADGDGDQGFNVDFFSEVGNSASAGLGEGVVDVVEFIGGGGGSGGGFGAHDSKAGDGGSGGDHLGELFLSTASFLGRGLAGVRGLTGFGMKGLVGRENVGFI